MIQGEVTLKARLGLGTWVHCLSVVGLQRSSSISTGCVVSLRGDLVIFCHTGSGRVGRVWSAREKSLEILRHGGEFNPGHCFSCGPNLWSCTRPVYKAEEVVIGCWLTRFYYTLWRVLLSIMRVVPIPTPVWGRQINLKTGLRDIRAGARIAKAVKSLTAGRVSFWHGSLASPSLHGC